SFPHYHHTYLQSSFFFFNDPATTGIYTLSLHDALPICARSRCRGRAMAQAWFHALAARHPFAADGDRQLHHHVGRGLSGTARCRSEERRVGKSVDVGGGGGTKDQQSQLAVGAQYVDTVD